MDYDQGHIPESYDAARGYSTAVLALWLERIASCAPRETSTILDLGCGTGRYSSALADHFGAHLVGVDRSERMLGEARKKGAKRVNLVRATAEHVPLRGRAIDMVFMSMVFHHFQRPDWAARECRRVLRPGGIACLRAGTTDRITSYAYVPFFPESESVMEFVLQSRERIESIFRDEGFELVRHELVRSPLAANWRTYAQKIAMRADSILARLSDREFEEGMRRLHEHAADAPEEPVAELVDLFAFRRP